MPNWKKLITSGSDAALNSLNVTSELTASGLNYPTTDGDNGDFLLTDGAGNLSFARSTVFANVKNVSGTTLQKGTPVHATGTAGNASEVIAASASVASTMPATYVLNETLADDAEGLALITGYINGVDTSAFGEGDIIYVGATGSFSNVKPGGSDNLIQNLGIVNKVDASNGSGYIYGSGRSNDVPNLPVGKIWVGSSTYSVTSSVAHLDETNERLGINTNTPDASLHVIGDISGSTKLTVGIQHTNSGTYSSIAGGCLNFINPNGCFSAIAGGHNNCIEEGASFTSRGSFIGGGAQHNISASDYFSIVGGAFNCSVKSMCGFIGGGASHIVSSSGCSSTVAGSGNCLYNASLSSIVAGSQNRIIRNLGTSRNVIIGGNNNCITGAGNNALAGGETNCILSSYSFLGGGKSNRISGDCSAIIGGYQNCTKNTATHAAIAGGRQNTGSAENSFIGGGGRNHINNLAISSSILGGFDNSTNLANTHIIGSNLTADKANYTYVNNLDVEGTVSASIFSGSFVGDGSGLTGITTDGDWYDGTTYLSSSKEIRVSGTISGSTTLTIGSGHTNTGTLSSIAGGIDNSITIDCSFIGGGKQNCITGGYTSAILGGRFNCIENISNCGISTIVAGQCNYNSGPNAFIGAGSTNCTNAPGGFIGGGNNNYVTGSGLVSHNAFQSSVVGGQTNRICGGTFSFIGGGAYNRIFKAYSSNIVGGASNCISGSACSVIVAGNNNCVAGGYLGIPGFNQKQNFIGAGGLNRIDAPAKSSAIVAGCSNTMTGGYSSVVGGKYNCVTSDCAFIGGGVQNCNTSDCGVIVGGQSNINDVDSLAAFIGAGCCNTITNDSLSAVIVGGDQNIIDVSEHGVIVGGNRNKVADYNHGVIVGGTQNTASGACSFIGGGQENHNCSLWGVIGGGLCNFTTGDFSAIAGGCEISINATNAFIGGGDTNEITTGNHFSGILGGQNNTINHTRSFIIGSNLTSDKACYTFMNNLDVEGTVSASIFSGSFVGDGSGLTNISAGSVGAAGSNTQVQYNNGGSLAGSSNLTFDGTNLTVGGTVTANEIVTNVVSQSISFATGSNRFGDEISDTHTFTGSLLVTGSLNLSSIVNAGTDTDKFLVLDSSGNVDFRTGANVLSDIGATTCTGTVTGTGTQNTIPKWGSGGTGLQDSQITDNGTNVEIDTTGTTRIGDISAVADNGYLELNGTELEYYAGGSARFIVQDDDNIAITGNIYHIGDTNTKIGFVANDTFAITTAGSERIRVTSTGNVGIGTETPQATLDVIGDISGSTKITIGSGHTNTGTLSSVAGGCGHYVNANCVFIGGGSNNRVTGNDSFIGAGFANTGSDPQTFIGAGGGNKAGGGYTAIVGGFKNEVINYGTQTDGCAEQSFIGSGISNCIAGGGYGTIVGGFDNFVSASDAGFIGAGINNTIAGGYATNKFSEGHTIAGGKCNKICYPAHHNSFIGGGFSNEVSCDYGTIGGGRRNCVTGGYASIIGGGCDNTVVAAHSTIVGGHLNCVCENCSFIGGGCSNDIQPNACFSNIVGGEDNYISSLHNFIGGGKNNCLVLPSSSIAGGFNNQGGANSNVHILGSNITADKSNYTFVNNIQAETNISGSTLSLTGLANQASEATAVMINGSNVVGTRELGSNAFNSTAFVEDNGGATNEIAFWSSATAISGSGDLTWDGSTLDTNGNLDVAGTVRLGYTGTDPVIFGNPAGKRTEWNNPGYFEIYAEDTDSPGTFRETIDIDGDYGGGGFIGVYPSNSTNRSGVHMWSQPNAGRNQLIVTSFPPTGVSRPYEIEAAYISGSSAHPGAINYTGSFLTVTSSYDNKITIGTCVTDANVGSNNLYVVGDVAGTTKLTIGSGHTNSGTLSSIAGGDTNCLTGNCSFIGGGCGNYVTVSSGCDCFDGDHSSVVGGELNRICGALCSIIGGGCSNRIFEAYRSSILAGSTNCISGSNSSVIVAGGLNCLASGYTGLGDFGIGSSMIGAGQRNRIDSPAIGSAIVAGIYNTVQCGCSFIGAGCGNCIAGGYSGVVSGKYNCVDTGCSLIGGGDSNHIQDGHNSVIGGGYNNCVSGSHAGLGYQTIAGGCNNKAMEIFATVGGGGANCACGYFSVIGGGEANLVTFTSNDYFSGIFSGCQNTLTGNRSFIGGGSLNIINGPDDGVIAGGRKNCITGNNSFIGAGTLNTGSGACSGILGGKNNYVNHDNSFIVGSDLESTAACYTFMNNACVAGTTRTTTLVETSARRFKECILPLQDQIENIKKLEPVEFQWKKDKTKDIGFIAEDVLKVYPDLIAYEEDGEINGIQYSKLTTVLVKALQQQQEQIDELKKEIFILKQQG